MFFAIWWAWMSLTWFASSYDTDDVPYGSLVVGAVSGLVLLFALWWLSELEPSAEGLSTRRGRSFLWGYGYYGVFAAQDVLGTGYAVAVPTAAFLALLWLSHSPIVPRSRVRPSTLFGAAAVAVTVMSSRRELDRQAADPGPWPGFPGGAPGASTGATSTRLRRPLSCQFGHGEGRSPCVCAR